VEAEVRAILAGACSPNEEGKSASSLQEWVDKLYGKKKPRRVVERLIAERRKEAAAE
jgi:hypothetical protein